MKFFKQLAIILFVLSLIAFNFTAIAQSQQSIITKPTKLTGLMDLQALGQESKQQNLPIMLMFTANWCPFCHTLIDEVLDPMILGGQYDGKYMLMRYVDISTSKPIIGIDGKPIKKRVWAESFRADLVPTILFLDGEGKEVAPRIIGIANIEFYPALIHRNLNIAYKNMNNPLRIPVVPNLMK